MRSFKQVIFSLLIFSIYYDELMAADSPCGDWEPYKGSEKCFKIIDENLRTYDDAEKSCSQLENSSTLPIIRSKDEQDFLSNLLFKTHKAVDNVWIGIKYTSNKFKWIDDSELSYTNWIEGSPKNKTDDGCVQMQSEEASVGKWVDEPCTKKNLVACQKMQTWSLSRLQQTLLDARRELKDSLENARKEISGLKQNPVPIGFIYVQLPSQPEPKTLWSTVEWKDVSSEYAGLFFRVLGGGSADFGVTQKGESPRLTQINWGSYKAQAWGTISVQPGQWSQWVSSGITDHGKADGLQFLVSNVEVRPPNTATRIWKRTN